MSKGRKPANGVSKKDHNYRIRMTKEDYDLLKNTAKEQQCTMADLIGIALNDFYGGISHGTRERDQVR